MHIMEGYLPPLQAISWAVISVPFLAYGTAKMKRMQNEESEQRFLFAVACAYILVLSALKLPSLTGSCSHPTGIGLGAILFGPALMTVAGLFVLLFQALMLAHGGLTTLGANLFSMAIVGGLLSYYTFRLLSIARVNKSFAIFFAVAVGNLATYSTTALQLSLAFPDQLTGFIGAFGKFLTIFAITQVPVAFCEGLLTVLVIKHLQRIAPENLLQTLIIKGYEK